jgi:hypothetical protein
MFTNTITCIIWTVLLVARPWPARYTLTNAPQEDVSGWLGNRQPITPIDVQMGSVGHTPRVLMQGRKKGRRRTPTRIPLYSY